jgi:predicted secreted Zn-dependent protease
MRTPLALFVGAAVLAAACARPAAQPPQQEVQAGLAPAPLLGGASRVALQENVHEVFYTVAGADGEALRAALDSAGPFSPADGRRYDSLTIWSLKWSFRYDRSPQGCGLNAATIELDVVTQLPDLADKAALPAALYDSWRAYRRALEAHEQGHVARYRAGAAALQAAFEAATLMADCRELGAALAARGEAQIAALRAADRAYDRATDHGRSQGAVFP